MNTLEIEEKFLDYLEHRLSEAERLEVERVLESSESAREAFKQYQAIVEGESLIASEEFAPGADLAVKVMEKIEERSWRFKDMLKAFTKRELVYPFATAGVVAFALLLSQTSSLKDFSPENPAPLKEKADQPMDKSPGISGASTVIEAKPVVSEKQSYSQVGGSAAIERKVETVPLNEQVSAPTLNRLDSPNAPSISEGKKLGVAKRAPSSAEPEVIMDFFSLPEEEASSGAIPAPQVQALKAQSSPLSRSGRWNNSYEYAQAPSSHAAWAGEGYGTYEENPRTLVSSNPVSTFSIDVDTGAYTNVRRFLRGGTLPPKDAVRIEEFLNYFSYQYPKQTEKPFGVYYEVAPSPFEKGRHILKLGVRAKDVELNSERPWNLVFLIDTSGSIDSNDKLPLLKSSMNLMVDAMRSEDRISIVTYSGYTTVALESTKGTHKETIRAAINRLTANGSTNGGDGIYQAYAQAERNRVPKGVNRVILATDGDFNVGVTSDSELIRLIEEKRRSGVTLTTLGFGQGNYQEQKLEQLANKGNGNYFYIDSFQEARRVLVTNLVSNMEVVAKDVKLQIEFNPSAVKEYRLIGYDNRKLNREDFSNDTVDAGEIGSGHTVTALYEIVLTDSELSKQLDGELRYQKEAQKPPVAIAPEKASELAFLKIRYKQPEANESTLIEYPIEKRFLVEAFEKASTDFRFAAAVSAFGHLLRESSYRGNYGYREIVDIAKTAIGEDVSGDRREFIELVSSASSLRP